MFHSFKIPLSAPEESPQGAQARIHVCHLFELLLVVIKRDDAHVYARMETLPMFKPVLI